MAEENKELDAARTKAFKAYTKALEEQQAKRDKLEALSYDSEKRGYEFEGKVIGKSELDSLISQISTAEKKLTSEYQNSLKSIGTSEKQSLALGAEYKKLVDTAIAVKVTDYDSSIENLKAWRNVQTFVENNKEIRSIETVTKNPSIVEISTSWLRTGIGPKYVKTVKDVDPKKVQANTDRAAVLANGFAEKDTTEYTTRFTKSGEKVYTNKKIVTDEPTLSARSVEIDSIKSGQEAPTEIATSARKGKTPTSNVTLTPGAKSTSATAKKQAKPAAVVAPKYGSASQFEAANVYTPPKIGGGIPGDGTQNGGLKKGEALVDGKKVKVGGSKWQQIIQDEFGSMWDVYNDNPDVHKIIDQAVKEGWYNDETKLTSRLQNTNWFRTTESATRQYNIKKSTDPATLASDVAKTKEDLRALSMKTGSGVVLSEASLDDLADKKIKFGWSEQQTMNALGSEAVATATSGGPLGSAALRQGSTAAKLRGLADDYAQKVDPAMLDKWTAEILSGTKTEDQFTEQMKTQASQQYRSLAPQIEKNQTVKQAVNMYSNQAQNILGVDPSTIDWTQDKWNSALNYRDPKTNEYRTMDAFEWNKHLRAQPEWQNTDDARSIYRNLALNLVSGFGKKI